MDAERKRLRDLDAEVHRMVMGGTCEMVASSLTDESDWWDRRDNGVRVLHLYKVPAYSSEMTAAWSVVEKLTEQPYVKVHCEETHFHGVSCTIIAPDYSLYPADDTDLVRRDARYIWGETQTMAEAICLAALAACKREGSP